MLTSMPAGHGPPSEPGSMGQRRQTKEMVRRAVEETDVPLAVYGWLELSKQELPLSHDRSLGYRPHDRLSGYHEMWGGDAVALAATLRAIDGAAEGGDPWAAWAMALRYRHGVGVKASRAQAMAHARAAAAAGLVRAQAALGHWLLASKGGAAEAAEWLGKAAAAGDEVAGFALERPARWAANVDAGYVGQRMAWGAARYSDVGFEGWGRLPLVDFEGQPHAALAALATEHSLLPPGAPGMGGPGAGGELMSTCCAALTPRFVVTLHDDPWQEDLAHISGLTEWAYGSIGRHVAAKERQLRLGVAAQLVETMYAHHEQWKTREADESGVDLPDQDDDLFNPVEVSKLLRLDWVFVHISALTPDDERPLSAEEIFPRVVELRYTLAEDLAPSPATPPPLESHRPPHRPQQQQAMGLASTLRQRFGGVGRWGWAEGRHIAVEVEPAMVPLRIRKVEVRG